MYVLITILLIILALLQQFLYTQIYTMGFPVAQMVNNPLAMWATWVWSLGWEDPLEEGMAIYSSITAWEIPWTEEPGELQSVG